MNVYIYTHIIYVYIHVNTVHTHIYLYMFQHFITNKQDMSTNQLLLRIIIIHGILPTGRMKRLS